MEKKGPNKERPKSPAEQAHEDYHNPDFMIVRDEDGKIVQKIPRAHLERFVDRNLDYIVIRDADGNVIKPSATNETPEGPAP